MTSVRCTKPMVVITLLFVILLTIVLFQKNTSAHHKLIRPFARIVKETSNVLSFDKSLQTRPIIKYIDNFTAKTPAQIREGWKDKKCNVYNVTNIEEKFVKANLKYSKGSAAIYVHGTSDIISKRLLKSSSWEGGYVQGMETAFNLEPNLNLIDIGCNLGVYTIVAAMRNRKVVAVDANINNIRRLKKSLIENKIDNRVQLLLNGISDRYMQFSISSPEKGNIGHTLLSPLKKNDVNKVNAIYLDDILEVTDFRRAIMKIDIEGHEFEAFRKADKLFTEIQIPIVMMEWDWIGKNANKTIPTSVIQFFKRFNYKPFANIFGDQPLNMNAYNKWPWDIVWKK